MPNIHVPEGSGAGISHLRSLFSDEFTDEFTDEGKASAIKPTNAMIAESTMMMTSSDGGQEPLRFVVEFVTIAGVG